MDQPNNIIGKDYWEFVEKTSEEATSISDLNASRDIDIYRAFISQMDISSQGDQDE